MKICHFSEKSPAFKATGQQLQLHGVLVRRDGQDNWASPGWFVCRPGADGITVSGLPAQAESD